MKGIAARKDHGCSVHGEELVKDLRRNQVAVWHGELKPDKHRLHSSHNQEEQRVHYIHQAQLLVIHRDDPLVQAVQERFRPTWWPAAGPSPRRFQSARRCCPCSFKGCQISDDLIEFPVIEIHCRHQDTGFN